MIMKKDEKQLSEVKQKVLKGLDIVSQKFIQSKKEKNSEIAVIRNGNVTIIKALDI